MLSLLPANSLKNKKIVVDCANGASYKVAPEVLKKLKAEVVVINDKPTGKNINLNCGALHPEIVAEAVKKKMLSADLLLTATRTGLFQLTTKALSGTAIIFLQ